jgi:hypothetical protein
VSGTGVLLTGEFIIVESGQIITIPRPGETEESVKEIVIPKGFQPLRLPDDIEETTNNQFGFILRNGGANNYTLNVKGLNSYEMAQINQPGENRTAFMNASANIKEGTWYKVSARISEDEITADLHDANGTLLESLTVANDGIDINELVILIANNTGRAVAFKDLKVETLNETAQLPAAPEAVKDAEGDKKAADDGALLAPYVNLAVLLVATIAAVVYVTRRRQLRDKTRRNTR